VPKINRRVIIVKELRNESNFASIGKDLSFKTACFVRSTGGTVCVLMRLQVVPTVLLVIN